MEIIQSPSNGYIKKLKSLETKKGRSEQGQFIIEGRNYVLDISEDFHITSYCISESYYHRYDITTISDRAKVFVLKDSLFKELSNTVTPQGILAVCDIKTYCLENMISCHNPFLIILENINDPGNLGTLIRTADGVGADGIILSQGSVDAYNKKAVRASAGSILHMPILEHANLSSIMKELKQHQMITIATHLKGNIYPYDVNYRVGCAILVGNEANGLSDEISTMADYLVKIPLRGKAESLNASIAGAVLMYEVLRQRL